MTDLHTALNSFSTLQLGVCARGGCEANIHSTSQLMSSTPPDQRWFLLLDFQNAFNSINRELMFEEIRHCIPSPSAWMEACYSQHLLQLHLDTIHSCCVVQQSDSLGPLGFALTLHPVVERNKAEVPSLTLNAWFLNDGTLVGSPRDLSTAVHIIERDGPSLGLNLNRSKSLLFIPEEAEASLSPPFPNISITWGGFTLLGCFVGPPSHFEELLRRRFAKVKTSLGALWDNGNSQQESILLRLCLVLPKVSFTLRTAPPVISSLQLWSSTMLCELP